MVVTESDLRQADGSPGIYGVVHKPSGVVVVAWRPSQCHKEGEVLMVEQYRYALQRRSWEFIAGTAPHRAEQNPNDLVQRELREETGYRAATVTKVGCIDVAPGFVDQVQHVFLMRDLTPGSPEREDTEADIVCRWWPLPKQKSLYPLVLLMMRRPWLHGHWYNYMWSFRLKDNDCALSQTTPASVPS